MGWKNITMRPVRVPQQVKTRRPNSKDEERILQAHSELLQHEDAYLDSRKRLALTMDKFIPSSWSFIGFGGSSSSYTNFIRSALSKMKTSLPRLDWQENCQACGRPTQQNEFELETVSTPRTTERITPTYEDAQAAEQLRVEHRKNTEKFKNKRVEFAQLLRKIGISASAAVFNRQPASLWNWVENTINTQSRVLNHYKPTTEGNCPGCRRGLDPSSPFMEILKSTDTF